VPGSPLSQQGREDAGAIAVAFDLDAGTPEQGEPGVAERGVFVGMCRGALKVADDWLATGVI
jgi:hypothetical protein